LSAVYIPPALRLLVIQQAGNRCGYCLAEQELLYAPLEFEHLQPRSRGGLTTQENLWLACRMCNGFKSDQTEYVDPDSRQVVRLFDPRRDDWWSHFRWSDDGAEIIGISPTGRATVIALQLYTLEHMKTRRRWVSVGWHPPSQL
jgi:hypothetical protein